MSRKLGIPFVLLVATSGCQSLWVQNRLADLTEAAHVETNVMAFGAMVNIGPLPAGLYMLSGPDGYGGRVLLGLGGILPDDGGEFCEGSNVTMLFFPGDGEFYRRPRSRWGYGSGAVPPFASVGVEAGALLGFGIRVDFLELVDFLLGFAGLDIMDDDTLPPSRPAQPANPTVSDPAR